MQGPRLLDRHSLPNGLTLELWDHSRPVAGDRWFVSLAARIVIPVRPETLPPELQPQAEEVIEALGGELIFSRREERNFIASSEAPALLQDMQERILAQAPAYFGHAEFASRLIRRKFAEHRAKQQWQEVANRGGDRA